MDTFMMQFNYPPMGSFRAMIMATTASGSSMYQAYGDSGLWGGDGRGNRQDTFHFAIASPAPKAYKVTVRHFGKEYGVYDWTTSGPLEFDITAAVRDSMDKPEGDASKIIMLYFSKA